MRATPIGNSATSCSSAGRKRRGELSSHSATPISNKAGIGRNAIAGELHTKQDLVNAKVVTNEIASECDHTQRDDE